MAPAAVASKRHARAMRIADLATGGRNDVRSEQPKQRVALRRNQHHALGSAGGRRAGDRCCPALR